MSANYVNIAGGTTYTLTVNPATLTLQNNQFRLVCKTAGGAITIILPEISSFGTGIDSTIYIDDADDMASSNNITVLVAETNTLENGESFVLNQDGQKVEIFIASKTEYGISGNSGSSANATLLGLSDGGFPIENNPSQSLIVTGISKIYATLYLNIEAESLNLSTISFPDLRTLIGGVYFVDDETGSMTFISFPQLENVTITGDSFIFANMLFVTNIDLPKLKNFTTVDGGVMAFDTLPSLTELNFPQLLSAPLLFVGDNTLMTSFSAPLLNTLEVLIIVDNPALTTIDLSELASITSSAEGSLTISGTAVTTLTFPLLVYVAEVFVISGNTLLTSITLASEFACPNINVTNNALSQASVDAILSILNTNGITVNFLEYDTLVGEFEADELITGGTSGATATLILDNGSGQFRVNKISGTFQVGETITGETSGATANTVSITTPALGLEGGTNSAPSAGGLISKASLVAKGWTVTNN